MDNLKRQLVPAASGASVKKRITFLLAAVAMVAGVLAFILPTRGQTEGEGAPAFVVNVPPGYRDWKLISVAHEEGNIHSLGAILGNDVAINAFREGKLPFPDGAIIVALHWSHVPSEENNKVFGRAQSFVPGRPSNIQFMVKDSTKYAATDGWGFGHFKDGKPADAGFMKTCFPCHEPAKSSYYVYTHYAP